MSAVLAGARVAIAAAGADRRGTSRRLLARLLPERCSLTQVCPACGGAHGPVRARLTSGAPGPLVSVSYAGGFAAAAVAPGGARAFGLDMELDDDATLARVWEALAAGARGDGAPTIADWTRLEAIAKARGTGLREAPLPAPDLSWSDTRIELGPGASAVLSVAQA